MTVPRPGLHSLLSRGEDWGPAWEGWEIVQRVASSRWPSGWSFLDPSWRPPRHPRPTSRPSYFYVWRMTASAPRRGTIDWRWDPDRGRWACQLLELSANTSADTVAHLWRDGQKLLRQAKAKGGRARRIKDIRAALALAAAERQSWDKGMKRMDKRELADAIGYSVRRLDELWKEEREKDPSFPTFDQWLRDNDLD